jgi:hypothetical protein
MAKRELTMFVRVTKGEYNATLYPAKPIGTDWHGAKYIRTETPRGIYHVFMKTDGSEPPKVIDLIKLYEGGHWRKLTL